MKKRSVASDKELLAAHERKIRAWTRFIHAAITREMQKKQHIDADACLAIGEALVAVLAVQLTTLATDARMAAEDFANGLEGRSITCSRIAGTKALGLPDIVPGSPNVVSDT